MSSMCHGAIYPLNLANFSCSTCIRINSWELLVPYAVTFINYFSKQSDANRSTN